MSEQGLSKGKYEPLGEFLASFQGDEVVLSWAQLEELVGKLPGEAPKHPFWANTDHHSYRRGQWLNHGFKAFFIRPEKAVRFTRFTDQAGEKTGAAWTVDELQGCVEVYRQMWDQQEAGNEVKKSEWRNEALKTVLTGRSEGAFEYRMQNISEVLRKLGIPPLTGYLPATNIGANQEALLIGLVAEYWDTAGLTDKGTDDPEILAARVEAARSQYKSEKEIVPPAGADKPEKKGRLQTTYDRCASVVAFVELQAGGNCEACDSAAPFVRDNGRPFLEVHHVVHLSDGGPDRVDNAVALCPNCHRRLHHGQDKVAFRAALYKKTPRLKKPDAQPHDAGLALQGIDKQD